MSFKVSYENMLGNEVVVAIFVDENYVFDYMSFLLGKLNTTIFVEKVNGLEGIDDLVDELSET